MEQSAFLEHAIERYGKATYKFAYRLTGNDEDASDLTQDAFIRVFRAWKSFKPGTSFLSWIYRIETNLYLDELRRRKVRFYQGVPERAVATIDEYVEAQLSEPVSKALGELSGVQRKIVMLALVDGCTYREIAAILGCSIGTIRSRLHRARALLRKSLAGVSNLSGAHVRVSVTSNDAATHYGLNRYMRTVVK
jgi:RNA polymerase sigma-70 factor (ECF subfamily)